MAIFNSKLLNYQRLNGVFHSKPNQLLGYPHDYLWNPLKYGCGVGQGRVDRTDVAAQDYQLDLTESGQ